MDKVALKRKLRALVQLPLRELTLRSELNELAKKMEDSERLLGILKDGTKNLRAQILDFAETLEPQKPSEPPLKKPLTRKELVAKAKSLGIKANLSSEVLRAKIQAIE